MNPAIIITDNVNSAVNTGDILAVVVSDDMQLQTWSLLYGYSADATCNSGDTYTNIYQSWTSLVFNDATHNWQYLCFQAIDHVGNVTYVWTTYPLIIDVTAPVVSIVSGSNLTENGIYTATFTGTDNLSWVLTYECQIDTGSWSICQSTWYTVWGLWYGNHIFSVRAIDAAGNVSNVATRNFIYQHQLYDLDEDEVVFQQQDQHKLHQQHQTEQIKTQQIDEKLTNHQYQRTN